MLFTFPSRYWYTIGHTVVFSLARWCWRIPAGFLRSRGTQGQGLATLDSRTGLSPSLAPLSNGPPVSFMDPLCPPYNPREAETPLVWAVPRSLAATWGITIVLFSSRYLDVSVHGVRRPCGLKGFPHSDTCGSKAVCAYPQLFAAYRVLLRLCMPRHPPCALPCFLFDARLGRPRQGLAKRSNTISFARSCIAAQPLPPFAVRQITKAAPHSPFPAKGPREGVDPWLGSTEPYACCF